MNNNHFYKSTSLFFVYLELFCKYTYDDMSQTGLYLKFFALIL